ncbi:hypothetical protein C2845_PM10G11280 [Panicum miliaceum]|uniref:Glycosyltransferase n=1 Tax=Panicum miliaceum TaxID=4540 RepID=A0A3L6PF46_PANMI|nr:hypothetical protein C2845_PM10G11280 [Panicum miliaceum]
MAASPPSPVLRHVAMLPFMAKGHTIPLLHLARVLLGRGLASAVTFLATPRNAPFVRAGAPGAAVVELPFPSSTAGPQSMDELPRRCLHCRRARAGVRGSAGGAGPARGPARPRRAPRVGQGCRRRPRRAAARLVRQGAFPSCVSLAVLAQKPHARVSSPLEPFEVDGLPGLRLTKADLPPPFDDPEPADPHWDFICESSRAMGSSRGSILNSFHELESFYIDKWNCEMPLNKMWPVGPLCLASEPARTLASNIADWLDSRLAMNRPVLYVAFGSQADLSRAQLEEIATGLDRSDLDFIWVVRSKWFDGEEPFQGRFRDRGKVVQGFINQLGILSHQAIKGFFSHCGWNSVMESISMGVPILTYPIAAEQKLNAKFFVDVLEVGIRIWPSKRGDSGPASEQLVSSDEVETLARELILGEGGKRAAAKASELAASARAAVETGGSSFET